MDINESINFLKKYGNCISIDIMGKKNYAERCNFFNINNFNLLDTNEYKRLQIRIGDIAYMKEDHCTWNNIICFEKFSDITIENAIIKATENLLKRLTLEKLCNN